MSIGPTIAHAVTLPDAAYEVEEEPGDSIRFSLQGGNSQYGLLHNKEFHPPVRDRKGSIVSGNLPECEVPEQTNWVIVFQCHFYNLVWRPCNQIAA